MPIVRGQDQTVSLTLRVAGSPVRIDPAAAVTVQLFASNGTTSISGVIPVDPSSPGSNWANGIVVVELTADDTQSVSPPSVIFYVTAKVGGHSKVWSAAVSAIIGEPVASSALLEKPSAVARLRAALSWGVASKLDIDQAMLLDDDLWDLWLASEADASRRLGVPLQATQIFDTPPDDDEVDALNGTPYLVEPGYDLPPDFFGAQSWGALKLRITPVIRIQKVRIVYPSLEKELFEVPLSWIKLDNKYGMVHIIPGPNTVTAPLSIFTVQAIASGVQIPHVIRIKYLAGIDGKSPDYADLVDLVKQMALLRVLQGAFLPTSGSISADGLSQSYSNDIMKYEDSIAHRLDIIKTKLIGPVWGVL